MGSESADLVFNTCGVQIPLGNGVVNLPNSVKIVHDVPETYKNFEKLRRQGKQCDVKIRVGEKNLLGHREILTDRIPFFRALFNSNMTECASGEIDLSSDLCELNPRSIECLLDYAYTGQLKISTDTAQEIMIAANFLNLESIMDECAQFMIERLTFSTVPPLLHFFRAIGYDYIKRQVAFFDTNFVPFSRTPEFLELSVQDVEYFLQRKSLRIDDEKQVFDALSLWIETDSNRNQFAARLLKCLRCTRLSETFITEMMEEKEWVRNNHDCIELFEEAKDIIRNKQPLIESKFFKADERAPDNDHKLFFALSISSNPSMQLYNPITNTWTRCPHQKTTSGCLNGVAVTDKKIYVIGRFPCEYYDTVTNYWHTIPNMSTERYSIATGVIDGKIYVAGGSFGDTFSNLEAYDPSTQEWRSLKSMTVPRHRAASCVLDGKLYVIGGETYTPFPDVLNCGEYYDPQTDCWTPIAPMRTRRCYMGAAVLNGYIYVVGGFLDDELDVVERYDPTTDRWTTLNRMESKRGNTTLTVSCGKLFVIDSYLNTVDMYHPETDTWEEMADMLGEDDEYFIGVIPIPASFPFPLSGIEIPSTESSRFRTFHLKDELLRAIIDARFNYPYDLQNECITQALLGKDVICQAASRTGKTTFFVISTLQKLEHVDGEVSVLVICSTRERATKISKEYEKFIKHLPEIKMNVFTGDVSIKKNMEMLKNNGPHIVIGTSGRICTLVQTGALKLNKVQQIVIDECENITGNCSKRTEVEKIFSLAHHEKQVIILSANLNKKFRNECKQFVQNGHLTVQYISK